MSEKRSDIGKKVGGHLYLHISALGALPSAVQEAVQQAITISRLQPGLDFNVVKMREAGDVIRLSLLRYEDFDEAAFPALIASFQIDLVNRTVSERSYSRSENPPILHRKELLLGRDHPRFLEFSQLTLDAEQAGLFSEPTKIGFRKHWENKIKHAGYILEGHKLNKVKIK